MDTLFIFCIEHLLFYRWFLFPISSNQHKIRFATNFACSLKTCKFSINGDFVITAWMLCWHHLFGPVTNKVKVITTWMITQINILFQFVFCFLALSTVLESTAFLGDIVLRLPDIAHELLDGNDDWKMLTQWAIDFTNDTRIFIEKDRRLISMVCYPTCMSFCWWFACELYHFP